MLDSAKARDEVIEKEGLAICLDVFQERKFELSSEFRHTFSLLICGFTNQVPPPPYNKVKNILSYLKYSISQSKDNSESAFILDHNLQTVRDLLLIGKEAAYKDLQREGILLSIMDNFIKLEDYSHKWVEPYLSTFNYFVSQELEEIYQELASLLTEHKVFKKLCELLGHYDKINPKSLCALIADLLALKHSVLKDLLHTKNLIGDIEDIIKHDKVRTRQEAVRLTAYLLRFGDQELRRKIGNSGLIEFALSHCLNISVKALEALLRGIISAVEAFQENNEGTRIIKKIKEALTKTDSLVLKYIQQSKQKSIQNYLDRLLRDLELERAKITSSDKIKKSKKESGKKEGKASTSKEESKKSTKKEKESKSKDSKMVDEETEKKTPKKGTAKKDKEDEEKSKHKVSFKDDHEEEKSPLEENLEGSERKRIPHNKVIKRTKSNIWVLKAATKMVKEGEAQKESKQGKPNRKVLQRTQSILDTLKEGLEILEEGDYGRGRRKREPVHYESDKSEKKVKK